MFNQVLLKGRVEEIYAESIDILVDGVQYPVHICDVNVDNLLLNNVVAIRGHIETSNNRTIFIQCNNLIILDGRGKKYGN